jgi:hypothetical protein
VVPVVSWNPADKHLSVVLSNGNLTATSGGSTRATLARSSGKYYFECRADSVSAGNNSPFVGIVKGTTMPLGERPGVDTPSGYSKQAINGYVWNNAVASGPFTNVAAGDVVRVAVDFDAGQVFLWLNSALHATFGGVVGSYFPCCYTSNCAVTARFAATDFTFAPPSGFLAWGG